MCLGGEGGGGGRWHILYKGSNEELKSDHFFYNLLGPLALDRY